MLICAGHSGAQEVHAGQQAQRLSPTSRVLAIGFRTQVHHIAGNASNVFIFFILVD